MTLREVLHVIRRNWSLILVTLVVAVGAGAAISAAMPARYESETQVLVTPVIPDDPNLNPAQAASFVSDQVATYAALARTSTVLDPVIQQAGLDETVTDFADDVTAEVLPQTSIIHITVEADSAPQVVELTRAVSAGLIKQIQGQAANGGTLKVTGTVVQEPIVPDSPSSPNLLLNLVVAGVIGLAVAFVAVACRQALTVGAPSRRTAPSSPDARGHGADAPVRQPVHEHSPGTGSEAPAGFQREAASAAPVRSVSSFRAAPRES